MSVLIKGMEMPKGFEMLVVFSDGTVHKCLPGMREHVEKGTAVPVPPHGDLIDQSAYRDEFMDGVYDLCNDDPDNYRANAIIDLFDDAPTIIPAEEGK